jgi:hypothetical protein
MLQRVRLTSDKEYWVTHAIEDAKRETIKVL